MPPPPSLPSFQNTPARPHLPSLPSHFSLTPHPGDPQNLGRAQTCDPHFAGALRPPQPHGSECPGWGPRATHPPALPKDSPTPKNRGYIPQSFLSWPLKFICFCTLCCSRDAVQFPNVPKCPQQYRPPSPKAREERGQLQSSPPGLGGQEHQDSHTGGPWAQPCPQHTHQLEDVLVLGHDGELQHIVTAGTGNRGVSPCLSPARR